MEGSLGSLVLGVPADDGLRYAGSVGSGITEADRERLRALLAPLEIDRPPLVEPTALPRPRAGRVRWVRPEVEVEVGFTEWTPEGKLRHPRYLGLRDDKAPEQIGRERG